MMSNQYNDASGVTDGLGGEGVREQVGKRDAFSCKHSLITR